MIPEHHSTIITICHIECWPDCGIELNALCMSTTPTTFGSSWNKLSKTHQWPNWLPLNLLKISYAISHNQGLPLQQTARLTSFHNRGTFSSTNLYFLERDWTACSKFDNHSRLNSQHNCRNLYEDLTSTRIFTLLMNRQSYTSYTKLRGKVASASIWIP